MVDGSGENERKPVNLHLVNEAARKRIDRMFNEVLVKSVRAANRLIDRPDLDLPGDFRQQD